MFQINDWSQNSDTMEEWWNSDRRFEFYQERIDKWAELFCERKSLITSLQEQSSNGIPKELEAQTESLKSIRIQESAFSRSPCAPTPSFIWPGACNNILPKKRKGCTISYPAKKPNLHEEPSEIPNISVEKVGFGPDHQPANDDAQPSPIKIAGTTVFQCCTCDTRFDSGLDLARHYNRLRSHFGNSLTTPDLAKCHLACCDSCDEVVHRTTICRIPRSVIVLLLGARKAFQKSMDCTLM